MRSKCCQELERLEVHGKCRMLWTHRYSVSFNVSFCSHCIHACPRLFFFWDKLWWWIFMFIHPKAEWISYKTVHFLLTFSLESPWNLGKPIYGHLASITSLNSHQAKTWCENANRSGFPNNTGNTTQVKCQKNPTLLHHVLQFKS